MSIVFSSFRGVTQSLPQSIANATVSTASSAGNIAKDAFFKTPLLGSVASTAGAHPYWATALTILGTGIIYNMRRSAEQTAEKLGTRVIRKLPQVSPTQHKILEKAELPPEQRKMVESLKHREQQLQSTVIALQKMWVDNKLCAHMYLGQYGNKTGKKLTPTQLNALQKQLIGNQEVFWHMADHAERSNDKPRYLRAIASYIEKDPDKMIPTLTSPQKIDEIIDHFYVDVCHLGHLGETGKAKFRGDAPVTRRA